MVIDEEDYDDGKSSSNIDDEDEAGDEDSNIDNY